MLWALKLVGISTAGLNESVYATLVGALIYTLSLLVVLGLPWLVKQRKVSREELGLQRLPTWLDILWAPAGAVVYVILTALVTAFAMAFLTFIDY